MTLFDTGEPAGEVRRVSLVRLSALIAHAGASIGRIAVEGEIHRPQRGKTGRQWFTLRDRASQITVSVPASRRNRCRIVAGERASVTGRLEWVNEWGQLQLAAEEVTPVGAGAIAAAIEETRRRLRDDGLLERPRKPIPALPSGVGVVCGHDAAVRADIESVVTARFPGYPVLFWETTVSGAGATDNIATGIRELDRRDDIEVIILARGGGDSTQLLPFSDEAVCRAVCASSTPVVAAIGHEGDRPLVDEVADLRCGTPSLAAAAVIPDRQALFGHLDAISTGAAAAWHRRFDAQSVRLERVDRATAARRGVQAGQTSLARASTRLESFRPGAWIERARHHLARIDIGGPAGARCLAASARLDGLRKQADALSPERVLERGYAVVRRADGSIVRQSASVGPGELVDVRLAAGSLAARVEEVR